MKINIGGSYDLLTDGTYKAVVIVDVWTPEHLIWVTAINEELKILCHPKNQETAQMLVDKHNEIYNSPLAKAMREET